MFVACWGSASKLITMRAERLTALLVGAGVNIHAVETNSDGQPAHLLYKKLCFDPLPWKPGQRISRVMPEKVNNA